MEKDHLKYCIIYMVDTGASKEYISKELSENNFTSKFLGIKEPVSKENVCDVIEEMIFNEELAYDQISDMLYVIEFMPRTASKITGKDYTDDNVKKTWKDLVEKFGKNNE